MQDEPFGPIAPITTFETLDEVAARANRNAFGLAGCAYTNDLSTAWLAVEALAVGMVGVNSLTVGTAEAPSRDVKISGFGREGGAEGIDGHTTTKYTNMQLSIQ